MRVGRSGSAVRAFVVPVEVRFAVANVPRESLERVVAFPSAPPLRLALLQTNTRLLRLRGHGQCRARGPGCPPIAHK